VRFEFDPEKDDANRGKHGVSLSFGAGVFEGRRLPSDPDVPRRGWRGSLQGDRDDPEDFPVDRAALDRAHMGRRIRRLRNRLGLTQEGFAKRYGIPLSAIRQHEIARTMPPPAVRAYLTVIEREPEMVARALRPDAA
jgi:putative transcriptional regulator